MTDFASKFPLSSSRVAELIVDHARDYAIFTLNPEGLITSWSSGAELVTGYQTAEAIGMNFDVLFTASDRAADQPRLELAKAWRQGRAEDTRWHLKKNGQRFWANGVTTVFREGDTAGLIKVMRDETRARLADEQRTLLLNELNHRINNTLVTVQSLVEQTLRSSDLSGGVREDLSSRLVALSNAHKLLVQQNWAGAELGAIVRKAAAPYQSGRKPRLTFDGPALRLSPQQAVSMALVLHELATNAVKYGALSGPDGEVAISWNLHLDEAGARHMTFLWQERGGPPVTEPQRRGFGTRLISRSFGQETAGEARIDFDPAGVRCTIDIPLSTRQEVMLDPTGE